MVSELQTKLDMILDEKNTNLKPENLRAGVTCLGVEGTFEGGSSTENVKLFNNIEEMNADISAQENDLALLYDTTYQPIRLGSYINYLYLPSTITVPYKIINSGENRNRVACYLISETKSTRTCPPLQIWIDGSSIGIVDYKTYTIIASYDSSDGLTYNLDSTGIDVEGTKFTYDSNTNLLTLPATDYIISLDYDSYYTIFDENASYAFKTIDPKFNGFYKFNGSEWIIPDNQLTALDSSHVLPGFTAFGKNGIITGDKTCYSHLDAYDFMNNNIGIDLLNRGTYVSSLDAVHGLEKINPDYNSLVTILDLESYKWSPEYKAKMSRISANCMRTKNYTCMFYFTPDDENEYIGEFDEYNTKYGCAKDTLTFDIFDEDLNQISTFNYTLPTNQIIPSGACYYHSIYDYSLIESYDKSKLYVNLLVRRYWNSEHKASMYSVNYVIDTASGQVTPLATKIYYENKTHSLNGIQLEDYYSQGIKNIHLATNTGLYELATWKYDNKYEIYKYGIDGSVKTIYSKTNIENGTRGINISGEEYCGETSDNLYFVFSNTYSNKANLAFTNIHIIDRETETLTTLDQTSLIGASSTSSTALSGPHLYIANNKPLLSSYKGLYYIDNQQVILLNDSDNYKILNCWFYDFDNNIGLNTSLKNLNTGETLKSNDATSTLIEFLDQYSSSTALQIVENNTIITYKWIRSRSWPMPVTTICNNGYSLYLAKTIMRFDLTAVETEATNNYLTPLYINVNDSNRYLYLVNFKNTL